LVVVPLLAESVWALVSVAAVSSVAFFFFFLVVVLESGWV
jgi:hypothetical protein